MKNIHKIGENIYITNDKDIKDGDWAYHSNQKNVIKIYGSESKLMKGHIYLKKIILTDNEDLIKDGIQRIDNEFLEWFFKNSSCEEVEVTKKDFSYDKDYWYSKYKIIIPEDKPKEELPPLPYEYNPLINKKQETIEEDSFTLLEKELIKEAKKVWEESHPNPIEMALFGAEWQAEQSYSEEDLKEAFNGFKSGKSFKEWLKQYKKK